MDNDPQRTGLQLFLSADLAGSTAFKQARRPEEWQRFFRGFYRQLPAYLAEYTRALGARPLPLWKTLGDEIVFTVDLLSSAEVPAFVAAFRSAVAAYRQEILGSPGGIDLKCAGWTAGFPVGNLRVALGGDQTDFIGPGMDIGFRLVKEATPQQMLLCVELAFLLSIRGLAECPDIFLGQGLDLKGVNKGRPYPLLWLDNFADDSAYGGKEEIALVEEHLRGAKRKACARGVLHDYCRRWIKKMGGPFVVPFIDGDKLIGQAPPGYDELLARVRAEPQGAEGLRMKPPRAKGSKQRERQILDALKKAVPHSPPSAKKRNRAVDR